jgi:hypothetical protein
LRQVLRIKGVIRTETVLALHTHIPYRTEPLISGLAKAAGAGQHSPAKTSGAAGAETDS